MKILLRTEEKGPYTECDVKRGSTVEDLYKRVAGELPYKVLMAKVENRYVELTYKLNKSCRVEFLDIRNRAASLVYQNSISLIFLKAFHEVVPGVKATIDNYLSQGLYIVVHRKGGITGVEIREISARMKELIDADIPITSEVLDRKEAIERMKKRGMDARLKLLESVPQMKHIPYYVLEGERDFFYGLMVPSTGYIDKFKLKLYHGNILLRMPVPAHPGSVPKFNDEKRLYEAFVRQTKWDDILGINYVADLNDRVFNDDYRDIITLDEALHVKQIGAIADMITKQKKRIVLIAGPSSSGKTTFAKRLCILLRVNGLKPMYMGTDDYFVNRDETPLDEHGEPNYEDLDALDIELFNRNMNDLLAGETVDMPVFDFIKGEKVFGTRFTKIDEKTVVVIEGIHAMNEELTKFIPKREKFKIYICPLNQLNIDRHNRVRSADGRLIRRIVRDHQYRGYSAQDTLKNWPKVRAGEDKNITPYADSADVYFNSFHVYELPVLRKYAEPLLAAITPDDPEYAEADRILHFIRFFAPIEDDSVISNYSIMREFIGGKVLVD